MIYKFELARLIVLLLLASATAHSTIRRINKTPLPKNTINNTGISLARTGHAFGDSGRNNYATGVSR